MTPLEATGTALALAVVGVLHHPETCATLRAIAVFDPARAPDAIVGIALARFVASHQAATLFLRERP